MPRVYEIINEGMRRDMSMIDSVSRNIANAQTDGFKREMAVAESLTDAPDGMGRTVSIVTDLSTGAQKDTGRPLDAALGTSGFFVATSESGEQLYTRRGGFSVNHDGYLTLDGLVVMGRGGEISLAPGAIAIEPDGGITQQGARVAQLLVVDLNEPDAISHRGEGYFSADRGVTERDPIDVRVESGRLETSNVEMMQEILSMMEASRRFESGAKVMKAYDAILDTTINSLAEF